MDYGKADAIAEIRDTFHQIKTDMDTETLDPWLEELHRVVAPITAGRYDSVDLAEDNAGRAVRADGLELALRLSMARFLQGLDGFLFDKQDYDGLIRIR